MTVPKLLTTLVCVVLYAGCTSSGTKTQSPDWNLSGGELEAGDDRIDDGLVEDDDDLDPELADDELGLDDDESEGNAGGATNTAEVEITDLRYVAARNGGTIVIRSDGRAQYRLREVPEQKQVVLEIANARLPSRLKRPYITREFNQSISAINAYQADDATTARVVVQLRDSERLRVEQRGNDIFLAPENSATGDSIAISGAEIEDDSGVENKALRSYNGSAGGKAVRDGLPMSGMSLDGLNYGSMRFYGKPISIEVRDTSVRDVIGFIAEQSGANLIVSEDVKGSVTLKLKQVPWDQALLLVMKSKQLGYVRQGNVLRVAPLALLQQETDNARRVVEAQRAAEPLRVRVVPVSYSSVDQLSKQVKEFLSARGKVVPDARTSSLIITDIVENIERATNLIKALDIPPLQVQIEAKVVEAREGFDRQVGINWRIGGESIPLGGDLSLTPQWSTSPSLPSAGGGNLRVLLAPLGQLGSLDAQLGLLESEELVKVISSPRIVTMNNEAANIAQVTQLPIVNSAPAATPGGVPTINTTFRDVTLSLEVTPQITSQSDVIMQVKIRREFAGAPRQGTDTPPINTREAKTRVMVQNGQTAVIGGIYQSDATQVDEAVPFLNRIPILGWFFKSRRNQVNKNELLLFLTPRILNSAEGTVKSEEI